MMADETKQIKVYFYSWIVNARESSLRLALLAFAPTYVEYYYNCRRKACQQDTRPQSSLWSRTYQICCFPDCLCYRILASITALIESVKKTEGNSGSGMSEALPYEDAKKIYLVDEVDDKERLKEIVEGTIKSL